MGATLPRRDRPYLANWMREGYVVVASDYAGLGTPASPHTSTDAPRRTTS
jgi:hypothetical protein